MQRVFRISWVLYHLQLTTCCKTMLVPSIHAWPSCPWVFLGLSTWRTRLTWKWHDAVWGGRPCLETRSHLQGWDQAWVSHGLHCSFTLTMRTMLAFVQKRSTKSAPLCLSLESHGLSTHDLVEATTLAESLGVRIDGLSGRILLSRHCRGGL